MELSGYRGFVQQEILLRKRDSAFQNVATMSVGCVKRTMTNTFDEIESHANLFPSALSLFREQTPEAPPPTIGVVGLIGVGKTATINALFHTALAVGTDVTTACTQEFHTLHLHRPPPGLGSGVGTQSQQLRIIDTPGLQRGELSQADSLQVYHTYLQRCDMILWVGSVHQRIKGMTHQILLQFPAIYERLVFGINQLDRIAPADWQEPLNVPSLKQEEASRAVRAQWRAHLYTILHREPVIISYSAYRRYQLELLFHTLLESCTTDQCALLRAWTNYSHEEFMVNEEREGAPR